MSSYLFCHPRDYARFCRLFVSEHLYRKVADDNFDPSDGFAQSLRPVYLHDLTTRQLCSLNNVIFGGSDAGWDKTWPVPLSPRFNAIQGNWTIFSQPPARLMSVPKWFIRAMQEITAGDQ